MTSSKRPSARTYLTSAGAFLFCFLAYYLCSRRDFTFYNNYSYLAQAWLDGHLYVDGMPPYLESVEFMGHQYVHFAPGVSLLCLPFVAIWGIGGFNCIYLAMFLGACNAVLAVSVLRNMGIGEKEGDRYWLAAMLILGTVHFFCATIGSSWFLGHVATLFFLLLALFFLTKAAPPAGQPYRYPFLSGLFFGLAVTCRMAALPGVFFFAGYLWLKKGGTGKEKLRLIFTFLCGAAVFGFLYMLYNYARFGSIMDQGYYLTYLKDRYRDIYDSLQAAPVSEQKRLFKEYRSAYGGPLQLKHIPYNLYSLFIMAPSWRNEAPYLIPELTGVSITFTSPLLYWGILADRKEKTTWLLWLSTILSAVPFLMNYGNGMAQFGMRYSMDFTPWLWLLMCRGLTRNGALKPWAKLAAALCFELELWGTLYWRFFY